MALPARQQKAQPALPLNAQKELAQLERDLGGRQHLVQALTFAKQTKDVRYLLGLIADPEHASLSLAEICRSGRILPGELVTALASGAELRSQLLAKQVIARGIPGVVTEVMHKAAEYEDDCLECMGTGTTVEEPSPENKNPSPQKCDTCKGGGRLKYPADPKCRDLALEMAGLVGGAVGGSVINVNNNIANVQNSSYEGLERMQEAMDQVLFGAQAVPALEAEAVDVTSAPSGAGAADVGPTQD
jgi:hypothetical protein